MRRIICLLVLLCLFVPCGFGEGLDTDPGYQTWISGVDTVYRPVDQPFFGTVSEGTICAFLDLAELADSELLVPRLVLATELEEPLYAAEFTLQVGKTVWHAGVHAEISEYDMLYLEDYTILLAGGGLDLLQAMAKAKSSEFPFTLIAEGRTLQGSLTIPTGSVQRLWKDFKRLKGDKQDLLGIEDVWRKE